MLLVKLSKLVGDHWKWVGTFKSREDLFEYKDKHLPKETIFVEEIEYSVPSSTEG